MADVGYMTNAWGLCAGYHVGVPSIKDLFYISTGSDEDAMRDISGAGFKCIEMFDGNLSKYRDDPDKFRGMLAKYGLKLIGVYTAANFIYEEILEEEFYKMNLAVEFAKMFGAPYINVGGGALRHDGIRDTDFDRLARGLDRFDKLARANGLIASFHHHLDSLIQTEEEIARIMKLTGINLCIDTAHIYAAGGDPVRVAKTYLDRLSYVHVKDYDDDFQILGKGGVDFDAFFDVLAPRLDEIQVTVEANDLPGDLLGLARHNLSYVEQQYARIG
ncbi:sugar phosphate isomerase/epimerase family protein [Rhodobium gokarnense]|uniref:Inosose dehydratase n=1 Tax=Rhodobium gokarnense TaxID=364296 RepID=A0ABT3HF22_9HYPH|nr:sugar phosphate isomerase/epimerase [Rhodobium gokarnense]MCW2308992.1 inosose dehydratase [Rhodobium gokarnense]